jgi:hypothetical protein
MISSEVKTKNSGLLFKGWVKSSSLNPA